MKVLNGRRLLFEFKKGSKKNWKDAVIKSALRAEVVT